VHACSAVVTTGIYCRPGCAARPRPEHVTHFQLAAAAEAARHPLFGEIELAQVLRFLRPIRTKPHPGRDCRSPVSLATVLDGHLSLLSR